MSIEENKMLVRWQFDEIWNGGNWATADELYSPDYVNHDPHDPDQGTGWAEGSPSADMCSAVGWLSFRRIVDIPLDACLAALESWQRTGQDGELHLGQDLLRGPIERDRDSGTCRIQVHLARRPLRPPLLMRLDIDRWYSSRTALELIPCKRARPTAGYFRAGHRLLDSLIHALPVGAPPTARINHDARAMEPSKLDASAILGSSVTSRGEPG